MEPAVSGWRRRSQAGRVRCMGEDSGERVEKVEIESEWVEWQSGLAKQQAYVEIDPRPDKENEDDHDYNGRLRIHPL